MDFYINEKQDCQALAVFDPASGKEYTESLLCYFFQLKRSDYHSGHRWYQVSNADFFSCQRIVERYQRIETLKQEILSALPQERRLKAQQKFDALVCAAQDYPREMEKLFRECSHLLSIRN